MERKLPESMYLIVKRNRENQPWQFPQGKLLDSESSLRAVSLLSSIYYFFIQPLTFFCGQYLISTIHDLKVSYRV